MSNKKIVINDELYTLRKSCRLCKSRRLLEILNLGKTPLADLFLNNPAQKEYFFPLKVSLCLHCFLVQLVVDVNNELLFGNNYAFYTGGSPSSIHYFEEYAKDIMKKYANKARQFTLEIASNDGTLLQYFKKYDCNILGIDPARNVVDYANKNNIRTIPEFFNTKSAAMIKKNYGKAGIIIANNVIAHVIDPMQFIMDAKSVLDENGIFIIECQYFPYLLFNNQFDNIYHEHRSFFSLLPLKYAFEKAMLKIIDIQEQDTQGGSIRIYATHKNNDIVPSKKVNLALSDEFEMGLKHVDTYKGFSSRINYIKLKLNNILKDLKSEGKLIAGYGASAKSNTLLNYCGIDTRYLDYIVDKTPYKYGLYTPGTHIKVIGDEVERPDYYLLLVWNYASYILQRESKFRQKGGKFIVPIPTPQII